MEKKWSTNDLVKLFKLKDATKTPLIYAEKNNEIPKAHRVPRGKVSVRKWDTSQLPEIGTKFGFLSRPETQIIVDIYTPKGGTGKTTFAANFSRIAAINGIKTLVCGLDFQKSITKYIAPEPEITSIDEIEEKPLLGLHHLLFEGANTNEVILKTEIPTLDIIPETGDLNFMAKKIRLETRKEYFFKENLIPKLNEYDLIIFDGNPGWSDLTENALVSSTDLIMPISCNVGCYNALKENLGEIEKFRNAMKFSWDHFYMLPTMLINTSISQNVYARYLNSYSNAVIPIPVRHSTIAEESHAAGLSTLEYDPSSPLANDYYDIIVALWSKICPKNKDDRNV